MRVKPSRKSSPLAVSHASVAWLNTALIHSREVFSTRYPRNARFICGEKGSPNCSHRLHFPSSQEILSTKTKEKQHVVIRNKHASQHDQTSTDLRHTTGYSACIACLNPISDQRAPSWGSAKTRPCAMAHLFLPWHDDHVGHSSFRTLRTIKKDLAAMIAARSNAFVLMVFRRSP